MCAYHLCIDVCVSISVHAHEWTVHSPVQAGTCGGQKSKSGVFLYHSPLCLLGQGLPLNLRLTGLARPSGPPASA